MVKNVKGLMKFMAISFSVVLFLGINTTGLYANETFIQNDETFNPISESQSEVLSWDKHTRAYTDSAFTPALATQLGTDEHIVFDGNDISFYGYERPGYLDYLYYAETDESEKTFSFTVEPGYIDTHTTVSYGFFVNCIENADGTISGYFVSREGDNLNLRMIDSVDIKALAAKDTILSSSYAGSSFVNGAPIIFTQNVGPSGTTLQNIVLKSENKKFSIEFNGAELFSLDLATTEPSKIPQGYTGGNDFGLYSAYSSHACSLLSFVTISDIKIHTATITPKSNVALNFIDYATINAETPTLLRDQFIQDGYIGQDYTITAPQFDKYIFLSDKTVMTGAYDATDKSIDLFYVNPTYVVEYVDAEGTKISDDLLVDGQQLQSYTVSAKEIAGYTAVGDVSQDFTLTEDEPQKIVRFVYEKQQPKKEDKTNILPKTGEKIFEQATFGMIMIVTSFGAILFIKKYNSAK